MKKPAEKNLYCIAQKIHKSKKMINLYNKKWV